MFTLIKRMASSRFRTIEFLWRSRASKISAVPQTVSATLMGKNSPNSWDWRVLFDSEIKNEAKNFACHLILRFLENYDISAEKLLNWLEPFHNTFGYHDEYINKLENYFRKNHDLRHAIQYLVLLKRPRCTPNRQDCTLDRCWTWIILGAYPTHMPHTGGFTGYYRSIEYPNENWRKSTKFYTVGRRWQCVDP